MKIGFRKSPSCVNNKVAARVTADITFSLQSIVNLNNNFVVNNTLWYFRNPKGQACPTVVNSATYISKKFQEALKTKGWQTEKKLSGQTIDGFIELQCPDNFKALKKDFFKLAECYLNAPPDEELDDKFSRIYRMYLKRNCFTPEYLPPDCHAFISKGENGSRMRIGLEFETGNIASSFRAFSKLDSLYRDDFIDAAVFITSLDRASAVACIWPISNRNGTFEELDNRHYERNILLPLFEFSFAPDGTDKAAPYLGSDGSTYFPKKANKKTVNIKNVEYEIYLGEGDRELLRPLNLSVQVNTLSSDQ
jgi:hypothetical protein